MYTYKQIYTFIYTFIIIYMNTHNFIHKIFILSFLSIVHSYIKSTILNTCKQIHGLVLIKTYIVTHVYKKNKREAFHITLYICKWMYCQQKLLLTALWLISDYFRNWVIWSYLFEQNEVHKNHFWVLFLSAKSIPDHSRTSKNFGIFSKIWNFCMFRPPILHGRKNEVKKKSFLSALS